MARLIFKCHYIKGGKDASAHLSNYVHYMATRENAEGPTEEGALAPATAKQKDLISQIEKDFPLSRGLLEYQDYLESPTQDNASEYIGRAIEENIDAVSKLENYVEYIAKRPGAEKKGTHALFSGTDDSIQLAAVMRNVAQHPGCVWLPIISLRREDAERLGYDHADQWRILLRGYGVTLAKELNIPEEQLRWYAAFHNEGHHPHVHMICYSADGQSGFLTESSIEHIKSDLARTIFRQELTELYQQKTEQREDLIEKCNVALTKALERLGEPIANEEISQLMEGLSKKLKQVSGKKVYGYLRPELKQIVDKIVDELEKEPRVADAYDKWYELSEAVLQTYTDKMPERLPLSKQKELKKIRNLVIQEALSIQNHTATFEDESIEGKTADEEERNHTSYRMLGEYRTAVNILENQNSSADEKQKAINTLRDLSKAGNSTAAYQLGRCYRDGIGVLRDLNEARECFLSAAEKEQMWAPWAMGKLELRYGRETEAWDWFEIAADHGNSFAQYQLGKMCLKGIGREKDDQQGAAYVKAAAQAGNAPAQYLLGKLFLSGIGVEKDREQAKYWLGCAAEQNHPYAQVFSDRVDQIRSVDAFLAVTRLIGQMSRIFEDKRPVGKVPAQVDRKTREKLRRRKLALGQRLDDHEDEKNNIALAE